MSRPAAQFVVVVGCGRLGRQLAEQLCRDGHSVVAVDHDEAALQRLGPEFSGFRVEGDAGELAVLREAKAAQADSLLAVTGNDNLNLLVAQVARGFFDVERVLARVSHPRMETVCREMGIDSVCPGTLAVASFLTRLGRQDGSPA